MKYIFLIIFILIITSCNKLENPNEKASIDTKRSDSLKIKTEIVQKAIDFRKLQWFYIDTTKLSLVKNDYTFELNQITKFGSTVEIKSLIELQNENKIHFLNITKLNLLNDSALIEMTYPSQGANASLKFQKNLNKWKVVDYNVYEN